MANFPAKVCPKNATLVVYNTELEGTIFLKNIVLKIFDPPQSESAKHHDHDAHCAMLLMHLRNERGSIGTLHVDTVSALALWVRRSSN